MGDINYEQFDYLIDYISINFSEEITNNIRDILENDKSHIGTLLGIKHGVSKYSFIFDDVILKVSRKREEDYCLLEYQNYLSAKNKGVNMFFPKTWFYKEQDGRNFYFQEKVVDDKDIIIQKMIDNLGTDYINKRLERYNTHRHHYHKHHHNSTDKNNHDDNSISTNKIIRIFDSLSDEERINSLMIDYGNDKTDMLIHFLDENRINDLRLSNFGYRNSTNKCVLFDFSGYGTFRHHHIRKENQSLEV